MKKMSGIAEKIKICTLSTVFLKDHDTSEENGTLLLNSKTVNPFHPKIQAAN